MIRRFLATASLFAALLGGAPVRADSLPPLYGGLTNYREILPRQAMPDLPFTATDGTPLRLSQFRGRLVLLHISATWSPSYEQEMKALANLQDQYKQEKLAIVPLAVDLSEARSVRWSHNQAKISPTLPLYLDRDNVSTDTLKTTHLPVSILIGADGTELGRVDALVEWDQPEAKRLLRHYLAK
jgi:hypothetical protein